MESLEKRILGAGDVVFRQGDISTDLYYLQSGRVSISITQPQGDYVLIDLIPGMLFGEMGLIGGLPRSVTATALAPSVVTVIPRKTFQKQVVGLPVWALSLARVMAERLKNTTAAFEKMIHDQAHRAIFSTELLPATVNLNPKTLDIQYLPESDRHRLYLAGSVEMDDIDPLVNQVNSLRRQKISPVILNFSSVVEIQRAALDLIVQLSRSGTSATGKIELENVQFIADRLRQHEGYQEILHQNKTPIRRVGFGEHLMRQGEPGTELFIVKTGSFTVYRRWRGHELVLCTAGVGDVVGELALITGKVRSASVRADKSSQVYAISIDDFRKNTYHLPPWFQNLIEGLAARVRSINTKLEDFLSGNLKPVSLLQPRFLKITENVQVPGETYLMGVLSTETLTSLQAYIGQRLKTGVREFSFNLLGLDSVDPRSLKYFVKLQEYLLSIHGRLIVEGPGIPAFGPKEPSAEVDPVPEQPRSKTATRR